MRMRYFIVFAALVLMGCVSCKRSEKPAEPRQEDLQAKKMLQGIWISADDDSPVLMAKGDSIFYPDSTSVPVAYKIISDTLFLSGATETSYAIERQTEHLFQFRNQTGDLVKLVKSEGSHLFFENVYQLDYAGGMKFGLRMYPQNELLPHRMDFCYVRWI